MAQYIDKAAVVAEINRIEYESEELEEAAGEYSDGIESNYNDDMFDRGNLFAAFKAGAMWRDKEYDDFLRKGLVAAKGMAVGLAYEQGRTDMRKEMEQDPGLVVMPKDEYDAVLDDKYRNGMEAMREQMTEDLPRWRKVKEGEEHWGDLKTLFMGEPYWIDPADLDRLPKED